MNWPAETRLWLGRRPSFTLGLAFRPDRGYPSIGQETGKAKKFTTDGSELGTTQAPAVLRAGVSLARLHDPDRGLRPAANSTRTPAQCPSCTSTARTEKTGWRTHSTGTGEPGTGPRGAPVRAIATDHASPKIGKMLARAVRFGPRGPYVPTRRRERAATPVPGRPRPPSGEISFGGRDRRGR